MSNLKYRVLLIVALCLVSVGALIPRKTKIPIRDKQGHLTYETVRKVPLQKGLDLQGGTSFRLEIDDSRQHLSASARKDAIGRALKTVRTRIDGIGVGEAVVQVVGDESIVVQIPGLEEPARARQMVEEQAFLEFLITDQSQSLERVLPRLDQVIKQRGLQTATTPTLGDTAASKSLNALAGLLKADTGKKADSGKAGVHAEKDTSKVDSLKIQPGGALSGLLRTGVGQDKGEYFVETAKFEQVRGWFADSAVMAALPPGKRVIPGRDSVSLGGGFYKAFYVTDARPIITGGSLNGAKPNQSPTDGTIVEFELKNADGRIFRRETAKHVGDYMAIVLDGIAMGSPPVIQSAIGSRGQITMGQGRDLVAAQDLALVLNAGALPVPLRIAEQMTIGPSLGADSIHKGLNAGIIAIIVVVVIMAGYYKFSGLLAVGGLSIYMLYTLAILAGFGAVLTLPGLAGFVLSIGIAVDANVLIFERIREEMDRGKTIRTAIDEGFRHAMPAIIDSNVSTILTASVLYQFGTGPVKGFAVTLIAGIVASLVTSIFVVRTFHPVWLNRSRGAQTLSI